MDVIRPSRPLTLMLPFRRYPLHLSHRLLDSLGGVSLFLLRALNDGLPQQAFSEVSGLTDRVLNEQLRFLDQHHFVRIIESDEGKAFCLTERGQRMITIANLLEQPSWEIWLDAYTRKRHVVHLLACPTTDLLRSHDEKFPATAPSVTVPVRSRNYHLFDEIGRLRTLLTAGTLVELLQTFWPGFDTILAEEAEHWEYRLDRIGQDVEYLPLHFDSGEMLLSTSIEVVQNELPTALLPIMVFTTSFNRVPGYPWAADVPSSSQRVLELMGMERVAALENCLPEDDSKPDGAIVLPTQIQEDAPELPDQRLPAGISASVQVRQLHVPCVVDAEAFHLQLQKTQQIRVFLSHSAAIRQEMAA